jgi:signal transduction histidine kinase/CheY-like chemotaxis protein
VTDPEQLMIDRESAENLAHDLLESAPCGYLAARPDGTLFKVNATFLAWTGYTREEVLSKKTFQELLTLAGRIYYETHVAPLLQMQGFVREVAFDLKRPGQPALPILMNAVLQPATGASAGRLTLLIFDASERRQYERELLGARRIAEQATQVERLAREEAERANRAKDDILALVSHELRTPLSAILGWTQVLRRKCASDPDIEQGLSVIEKNTRLQVRLVDDLLDMSRIVAGKLRLDVQQVTLAETIEAALQTVEPAAIARGVRLQRVLDSSAQVAGDPGRLQQVFWNLLTNGVKFTPNGGAVTVSMERIDSHIEVRVRDTGQGMTPELLAHVFERFHQSASEHTRKTGGLGLGLSLVKYLTEMHGGSIHAHSDGEGRGATFILKLPTIVAHERERLQQFVGTPAVLPGPGHRATVSLHGTRVVVVDDERDAREILWRVLTESGAEVVTSSTLKEALEVIPRTRPDVLVSDIELGDEDGYELIRQVRMLGHDIGRIPAIALTALSRLEDRTQALLAGYQIHLAKPVDAHELAVTVASLTGRFAGTD